MFGHRMRPPGIMDILQRLEKNLDRFRAHSVERSRDHDERVIALLTRIANREDRNMHNIDETLAVVTSLTTKTDGLITLVGTIKTQLDEALKNVNIPPEVQAKIDQIFDMSAAEAQKVDAAITANTPPTPSGA